MGIPTNEQNIRPGERSTDDVQAVRNESTPVVLTADGNLKSSAGYLNNLVVTNGGGSAITATLVNASSGSTPVVSTIAVPANSTVSLQLGWFFDSAIRLVSSSWTTVTACGGVS